MGRPEERRDVPSAAISGQSDVNPKTTTSRPSHIEIPKWMLNWAPTVYTSSVSRSPPRAATFRKVSKTNATKTGRLTKKRLARAVQLRNEKMWKLAGEAKDPRMAKAKQQRLEITEHDTLDCLKVLIRLVGSMSVMCLVPNSNEHKPPLISGYVAHFESVSYKIASKLAEGAKGESDRKLLRGMFKVLLGDGKTEKGVVEPWGKVVRAVEPLLADAVDKTILSASKDEGSEERLAHAKSNSKSNPRAYRLPTCRASYSSRRWRRHGRTCILRCVQSSCKELVGKATADV